MGDDYEPDDTCACGHLRKYHGYEDHCMMRACDCVKYVKAGTGELVRAKPPGPERPPEMKREVCPTCGIFVEPVKFSNYKWFEMGGKAGMRHLGDVHTCPFCGTPVGRPENAVAMRP